MYNNNHNGCITRTISRWRQQGQYISIALYNNYRSAAIIILILIQPTTSILIQIAVTLCDYIVAIIKICTCSL